MAATNFTPIILYHTTTASAVPTAGNLNNGELAINITDGKLFYKDNGGTVQVIATKGTGTIGGSNTQVQYNSSGALAGSSNFTFNGTTATINTLNLTNALGTTFGGTGLNSYTTGDLVYASGSNTLAKLGIGLNTYILTSTGSVPQWSAPSAVTVSTANNLAGGAAGSVPYQSGAGATTFLSIGTAGQILTSTGSAPQWSTLTGVAVTTLSFGTTGLTPSTATSGAITVAGTLATTNGGTGLTSFTANRVFYASSTSAIAQSANLTFDGTTLTVNNLTDSSLTSGRVTYAGTGGNLTDSANLTFDGTTLTITGGASVVGTTPLNLQRPAIPSFAGQGAPAIQWQFYSTGTTYTTGAYIQALADAAWSSTSAPTSLRFYTVPSGSITPIETMRNDATGMFLDTGTGGGRLTFVPGATQNQILSTTTGFGAYNILSHQATQYRWLNSSGAQALTLDTTGRLLIGITSGNYALDVGDVSGGNMFRFTRSGVELSAFISSGTPFIGTTSNTTLALMTNSTGRMWFDTSGRAALGSNNPSGFTTNPVALVVNSATGTAYSATTIQAAPLFTLYGGGGLGNASGMRFSQGGNFELFFGGVQTSSGGADFVFQGYNGVSAYEERARINTAGNFIVGGIATYAKLNAYAASGLSAYLLGNGSNASGLMGGIPHNATGMGTYIDGSGYGHGFISLGYTGDDGRDFQIGTASGSDTLTATFLPRVTFKPSGLVGIGQSPNLTQLEIQQNTTYAFGINNSGSTRNYSWRIDSGTNNLVLGTRTTSTDLVTVTTGGDLLVGTSSSSGRITVVTGAGSQAALFSCGSGTTQQAVATFSNSTNNGYLSIAGVGTSSAVGTWTNGSLVIEGVPASSGNTFIGTYTGDLVFQNARTNSGRFDSNGNFAVGTSSVGGSTLSGWVFLRNWFRAGDDALIIGHTTNAISGDPYMAFNYNGSAIGTITQNGTTAVAYNTSSDYRLKNSITPMTGALARVALLKPCTYKWNADGSDGEGFVAHELAEVCPHAVTGEKDAVDAEGKPIYQGIDTSFLVATLTAAIQEQQAIIESLKARLDAANL